MPAGENLAWFELTLDDWCDMDLDEWCLMVLTADIEAGWASATPGGVCRDLAVALPGGSLRTNIRDVPIIIDLNDDQEGF